MEKESFEYKYAAFKFCKTAAGIDARFDSISATIEIMGKEFN